MKSIKTYRIVMMTLASIMLVVITVLICAVIGVPVFMWINGFADASILLWEFAGVILLIGYIVFTEFWKGMVKAILSEKEV